MLDYAIKSASELSYERHKKRLFAVILDKKNRTVSEGANSYTKTSRRQYEVAKRMGYPERVCLHAEAAALFRSKGKGCKLIVARIDSLGNPKLAKPCLICEELIKLHGGIRSIEYTVG